MDLIRILPNMFFIFLLLSVFCISSPLSSALSPETLIQTPAGFVQIQHLRSGDTVVGIDLHTQKKVITKILKVRRYLVASRTKITTDQVVFTVSDDQLMRVERAPPDRAQIVDSDPEHCFVPAHNVCVGDRLQTYDGNYQTVTKIERIKPTQSFSDKTQLFRAPAHSATECAIFYGLHLDEPHHFYATEHSILMHNFAVAAPLAGELASMVCALGIGAAGSYFSPSNSGFNTPAFQAPATAPASSLNNFTQFRFDQLPPPGEERSAFSIRSSGNFNDHSFLFSGARSTRLSMVPAGNFIHQYPDLTWTFNGLMGFDGNLLFQAIAKEASTAVEHDAGIFHGYRHDPELQHIIHAHDAVLTRKLEHYFNDLSDAQFELLASQTGCYDDKTAEVQTALAAFDLMYAGSRFASTVAYVCKQENISLSAIVHTINHGTKASSEYLISPNYKVYESTENKLKVLTYEKPFSTILILGVSDLDGFLQVPQDATALEKYNAWREKKVVERKRYEGARKTQNRNQLREKNITEYLTMSAQRPERLKPLESLCPQSHACEKSPVSSANLALSYQNMEYGFSVDTLHFAPIAADFAIKNDLDFDTFMSWFSPARLHSFRQDRILRVGYWKAEQIAVIYHTAAHSLISMFKCSADALDAMIISAECLCDVDVLPLPENALMGCGTGSTKDPQFPQPPPIIEVLPKIPKVMCGGSGTLPDPKKSGFGTGQQKEPKPKETCNWSQEQKFPSFGGGDEVEIEEDESEKPTDKTKPPTGSDAPSIEKPADGSIPKIKTIDEPSAEGALRPTDLERIDGSSRKQEHIIEGSKGHNHRLELVAPEKTWEQVRPIIEDIMNTGEQGKDQTDDGVRCKFKYIDDHPVVVKYKEGTCINHIGTMFIPTADNIDGYIPKDKQK